MKTFLTYSKFSGLAVLFGACALFSCAYFNTFYLAKRNFNDGERFRKLYGEVRSENKKYYTAAIENASAILQDYRKSRYVDDSLFIIGMSYFHTKDYVRARTKFDEILEAFPKSEFAERARFYKAMCMMELGQSESARIGFNELMVSGSRPMRGQAGLMLAEISSREERWDEVVKAADAIIGSSEKETLQKALLYRGEGLYRLEKYGDAVETFQKVGAIRRFAPIKPRDRFRLNSMMAQGLARLGRYDDALKLLDGLSSKGNMAPFAPGIRLEIGKIYEMKGDRDKAVDTFSKMAADFPDSNAACEAWYRVGVITLRDLSKAQEARDAFAKVSEKKKIPETWFTDAIEKKTQIDSLKARMDRIEKLKDGKGESATRPDELAHERFLVAELLTYSLDHPEAALEQYKKILEEAPKSEFAVRSDFLTGLAGLDSSGGRTDEAEKEVMRRTIEKYPDSHFSLELKVRLGIIELPPDMKLLLNAEKARLGGMQPGEYLPLYQAVVDSFPNTRSGYQARFVIAWCYEHEIGDREKAFELYKKISSESQNENNREFLNLASSKLTMALDEKKIVEESKKNIAYYKSEIEQLSSPETGTKTVEAKPVSPAESSEFAELKKIRARNARIRGRYFTY